MKKKWDIEKCDEKEVKEIVNKYNLTELLATILVKRGIKKNEDILHFLDPKRHDFYDPYLMPDMDKAVKRIINAKCSNEKVIIYGDYDVDGITSTMVLKDFLDENVFKVDCRIPNRLNEGYGLNMDAIDEIHDGGYNLIITVDCGISSIKEIEYAYSLGMEVIVTDHHELQEKIPQCEAVIDCKREDSIYPFKNLAGCGVVFKLIQALSKELNINENLYLQYLDIVSIGTISDIVPLVDENRIIAKLGLKLINKTHNLGLKCLLESLDLKVIDSNTISYCLAPRINACGRMGHEIDALNLFLTKDLDVAKDIASKLNTYNSERQNIESKIYTQAVKEIEVNKLYNDKVIVLKHNNWHQGVIGIVSSKITDKYNRPSILLNEDDGYLKGSGRSVQGFDLHALLLDCSEVLEKYGGHEMAVGVTLKTENFDRFKELIDINAKIDNDFLNSQFISIEKEITLNDVNVSNIESLKLLEPYGDSNTAPLFLIKDLKIDAIRALSNGKHLKLTLKDSRKSIQAICFNMGNLIDEYRLGQKVDVVCELEINEYNNIKYCQLNVRDIRKSI